MKLGRRKDDVLPGALGDLAAELMQRDAGTGSGRMVWFTGAKSGVGCSTVVRSLALLAAQRAKRGVYLLDLDWRMDGSHASLALASKGDEAGAAPDDTLSLKLWLQTDSRNAKAVRPVTFRQSGEAKLFVSQFERVGLSVNAEVSCAADEGFWQDLRSRADLILVDAPNLQMSGVGASMCREADACVLVVAPDTDLAVEAPWAKEQILAAGGMLAGIIFNRAPRGVFTKLKVA